MTPDLSNRLLAVDLIDAPPASPEMEQERRIAIYDLIEEDGAEFRLVDGAPGPYRLEIALTGRKIAFGVATTRHEPLIAPEVPATALRRAVKDYMAICEQYFEALKQFTPAQIEAIDEERKAAHDAGAALLAARLPEITMNERAARRLFTLVAALLRRG